MKLSVRLFGSTAMAFSLNTTLFPSSNYDAWHTSSSSGRMGESIPTTLRSVHYGAQCHYRPPAVQNGLGCPITTRRDPHRLSKGGLPLVARPPAASGHHGAGVSVADAGRHADRMPAQLLLAGHGHHHARYTRGIPQKRGWPSEPAIGRRGPSCGGRSRAPCVLTSCLCRRPRPSWRPRARRLAPRPCSSPSRSCRRCRQRRGAHRPW